MMTNYQLTANAGLAAKFGNVFKPRDIFLHDGKSLRRFTIGAKVQMAAAFAVVFLLAWSAFTSYAAFSTMNSDVARMQRQVASMQADVAAMHATVRDRVAVLERRQAFLATMLSDRADAERLSALIPSQTAQPTNAAALAMAEDFNRLDAMQLNMVARAQLITSRRVLETTASLRRVGLDPARIAGYQGMGGPDEPLDSVSADSPDPRFLQLFTTWRQLDHLQQGVASIPSARPIQAAVNFTSGFGVRSDPFRGYVAMHAGIDLAGPIGTPIYATADGIVDRSEWNGGGYGNLVEIDHGQGIQTRYGHLSRRIAMAGQRVHRGDLIGLMGSTGRSTGSHLHYEVRIDGRAVNPIPFLQQGPSLIAMQRRSPDAPLAIGGPTGGSR